jgi:LasA protease
MKSGTRFPPSIRAVLLLIGLVVLACSRTAQTTEWLSPSAVPHSSASTQDPSAGGLSAQPALPGDKSPTVEPVENTGTPIQFPTPTMDPIRYFPTSTAWPGIYTVVPHDTIDSIAAKFHISREMLIAFNNLADPNTLLVGQILHIPMPESEVPGSSFKVIPDSEMVFSSAASTFQVEEYLIGRDGYLLHYSEYVNEVRMTGPEIVQYVALHYSVNPRLLLAVLEYSSGWITNPTPSDRLKTWPFVYYQNREGLYRQLNWAANQLNKGYYDWKAGAVAYWTLVDGGMVRPGAGINAGTAAVQQLMAQIYHRADWDRAVGPEGVFATFQSMFGYPFSWSIEPLIPENLSQPPLMLPIESGITWYFTGGPHGGWDVGSGWAAIDFAPPKEGTGCYASQRWVVAATDGVVVRSETGVVVLDLDFDRNEHTGWTLLYLHMATDGRAPLGAVLRRGDHVGHPSCEGGVAYATHFHFARRFNGEWIPAGGGVPFNLDGWIASSAGPEYEGWLTKNGLQLEACDCGDSRNAITR